MKLERSWESSVGLLFFLVLVEILRHYSSDHVKSRGPPVQLKTPFNFRSSHILCGCFQLPKSHSGQHSAADLVASSSEMSACGSCSCGWRGRFSPRNQPAWASPVGQGPQAWRAGCDWALMYISRLGWRTTRAEDLSSWTGE